MISVYKIKPAFQQLLKPVLHFLYKIGFTANGITWLAILLSIGTGLFCWFYPNHFALLILPLALLLRMALNALDGMMARTYNMQSKKGEILNELGDLISDFIMFAPLLMLFKLNIFLLIGFLFLSMVNEYTGILGKAVSGERRYEGPMGKSDRALIVGLFSLITFFTDALLPYSNYLFIVILVLLIISTGVRIAKTLKTV
jgi:CDP-diacylglycerol--glycerol-3-phosphate 3-phosphatidyltransferase